LVRTHGAQNFLYASIEGTAKLAGVEPEHAIAAAFKPGVPSNISPKALRSEVMLAIDLDHQAMLVNREIDDERTDRHLLADMDSIPSAKLLQFGPELSFAGRHGAAQSARPMNCFLLDDGRHGIYPHPRSLPSRGREASRALSA
jgi:hypothetical protein